MRKVLGILLLLTLLAGGCVNLGNVDYSPDNSPRIHVFTAVPDAVEQGKQVLLSWVVSDVSSVTIEPGIGVVELIGSRLVTVNAPTVFLLTATNRFGKTEKQFSVAVSGGVIVDKLPVSGGQNVPGLSDDLPPTPPVGAFDQPSAGEGVGSKPTVLFRTTPTNPTTLVPPRIEPGADWRGTWLTDYGKMTLTQSHDQVTGSYTYNSGKLTGFTTGLNTLIVTYSEAPTSNAPPSGGTAKFFMQADGNSFMGYRYDGQSHWGGVTWSGYKDPSGELPFGAHVPGLP